MSDTVDAWRDIREHNKKLKAKYGEPCPECKRLLPKAQPKILLPGYYCHRHRYRDPRPPLTNEQWSEA